MQQVPRVSNLGGRFGAKNICGGWADDISGLEQGKCQPGRHWHRSSLQLASVSSALSGAGGRSEGAAFWGSADWRGNRASAWNPASGGGNEYGYLARPRHRHLNLGKRREWEENQRYGRGLRFNCLLAGIFLVAKG